jgi:azurin
MMLWLSLLLTFVPIQDSGRVVVIERDDLLRFSVTEVSAKAGERITIEIRNTGRIPGLLHNFVLLAPGTNVAAFANEAMKAKATDYIPESMRAAIVAYTRPVDRGESARVTIMIPERGEYTFISSYPGHASVSKGTLIVR